jgi:hypothetical protein
VISNGRWVWGPFYPKLVPDQLPGRDAEESIGGFLALLTRTVRQACNQEIRLELAGPRDSPVFRTDRRMRRFLGKEICRRALSWRQVPKPRS